MRSARFHLDGGRVLEPGAALRYKPPMPSLHSTLNQLLEDFVSAVIRALRTSTVQELLGASSEKHASDA